MIMRKLPRLVQLAFVLLTGVTAVTLCALVLFSDSVVVNSMFRRVADGRVSGVRKEKQKQATTEYRSPDLRLSRSRQFAKTALYDAHLLIRGFTDKQIGEMSPLGKWLLSTKGSSPPWSNAIDRDYLILVWKHGPFLERRHIRRFTSNKFSPWDQCSVQNCMLSYDEKDLHRADAVIFHLHLIKAPSELPARSRRDQRWIFLTDESPFHTFMNGKQKLSNYNGLFNWSMSYRMDSDVPVPYGRTVRIPDEQVSNDSNRHWETTMRTYKTKLVAVMGSNCGGNNGRWLYVKALKSLLHDDLDILGRCLNGNKTACPGHFDRDCTVLKAYKFYLSLENSNCRQYLTEKVFWNAYDKFAVPIIMGASREDCQLLLPPRSFLHVDDFASADVLAKYLRYLGRDDKHYLEYHEWRRNYQVFNEHGYFGSASRHYCRVCEALNYNPTAPKVYTKLDQFWSQQRDCTPAKVVV